MSRCLDVNQYTKMPCLYRAGHTGKHSHVAAFPSHDEYDDCVNCGEGSANHVWLPAAAGDSYGAIKCLFAPTEYATQKGFGSKHTYR